DFFLDSHRRIFDAMICLAVASNPIDLVTLRALLRDRKELEQVGGGQYLATLIDGVPQTDTIEYYGRIVKSKSRERETLSLLNDLFSQIADGEEDLDAVLHSAVSRLARIAEAASDSHGISGVYHTLNDLLEAQLDEPEEIIFGLHRGEVAGLLAVTNYGKSTLLGNVGLSLAAGQPCSPFAWTVPTPRRVLYIDLESPATRFRADVQRMLHSVSNREIARANFITVVDAEINGEPLNLSRANHLDYIVTLAKEQRLDLVIIDTAASAFELRDENS